MEFGAKRSNSGRIGTQKDRDGADVSGEFIKS